MINILRDYKSDMTPSSILLVILSTVMAHTHMPYSSVITLMITIVLTLILNTKPNPKP